MTRDEATAFARRLVDAIETQSLAIYIISDNLEFNGEVVIDGSPNLVDAVMIAANGDIEP